MKLEYYFFKRPRMLKNITPFSHSVAFFNFHFLEPFHTFETEIIGH